jgi:hypothetical protein
MINKILKICACILALYWLSLGIVLPLAAPAFLPNILSKKAGLNLQLSQVRFNPFTFKLTLKDLRVYDQSMATVLRFDEAFIDLDPLALVKKEVLISNAKISKPRFFITISPDKKINLLNIFPENQKEPKDASTTQTRLFYSLKNGLIENGSIQFTDASKKEIFSTKVEKINFTLQDISTKPKTLGAQHLLANGALFEKISLEGGVSLNPFRLYGKLSVDDLPLPPLWDYLDLDTPYSLESASLWLNLPYRIFFENGALHVALDNPWLKMKKLQVNQKRALLASLDTFELNTKLFQGVFEEKLSLVLEQLNLNGEALHVNVLQNLPFTFDMADFALKNFNAKMFDDTFSTSFALLKMHDFNTFHTSKADPFAGFENLVLNEVLIADKSVRMDALNLDNLFLEASLDDNYSLDFLEGIPSSSTSSDDNSSFDWLITLSNLNVNEAKANVATTLQKHELKSLYLKAQNLQYPLTQSLTYSIKSSLDEAQVNSSGSMDLKEFSWSGDFELNHPKLSHYNPYLKPFFLGTLNDGALHVKGSGSFKNNSWDIKNNLLLSNLSLLAPNSEPIFKIESFEIEKINSLKDSLYMSGISLTKPYLNVHIYKNMDTNINTLFPPSTKDDEKASTKPSNFALTLEKIFLDKGVMDFADDSLPLPFQVKIENLNGEFSSFETQNTKPARVRLEGDVEPHGYVKIEGQMLPLDFAQNLNLNLLFNNIDMNRLSAYSGKFVGYALKEGKLDLDLGYKIDNSNLIGENSIILHDLTLGEQIESPDALSLPLHLAIALLKDSDGKIDINLPVRGDLNDPKFSYGALIFKAIGNLITGIVTSPFRFLGNILGIDGEALKSVQFEPGFSTLLPPAREKIANYVTILSKRPGISLKITPAFHLEADTHALKTAILHKQLEGSTGVDYGKLLTILYTQSFSEDEYEKLKLTHTKDDKLNVYAFEEAMFEALVQIQPLEQNVLEKLASQRAKAIYDALVEAGVAKEHLQIAPVGSGEFTQDRWVEIPMEIAL